MYKKQNQKSNKKFPYANYKAVRSSTLYFLTVVLPLEESHLLAEKPLRWCKCDLLSQGSSALNANTEKALPTGEDIKCLFLLCAKHV